MRAPGLGAWLARVAPAAARGDVAIAIVSDARMRALNREFRGKDHATDVLSFPSAPGTGHLAPRARTLAPGPGPRAPRSAHLGDIVIARGVAAKQARARGHSVGVEIRVLALHGLLHLLGYDHEADDGAMRRVEARLRRRGGLPGGLVEREAAR